MTKPKMKVQESGGINWTWFKVQNGNLVAIFRLHYDGDQLDAFRELQKGMLSVENIRVPFATWREECNLIANHTGKTEGYSLPEVVEAFSWLDEMFKKTADSFELKACSGEVMRHLRYHGVAICRIK